MPLTFVDPVDYERIELNQKFQILGLVSAIEKDEHILMKSFDDRTEIELKFCFSSREKEIILAGGLLNFLKRCD